MLKKFPALLVFCLALHSISAGSPANTGEFVSVKRGTGGYTLSISARDVSPAVLLREICIKCSIGVTAYGTFPFSESVRIRFQDMPLEEAIKRLLKTAGVENHLIRYSTDENGVSRIAGIVLFGSGVTEKGAYFPEYSFHEKVASFTEHYRWDSEKTKELAEYLLGRMPDPVRETGLHDLGWELDRSNTTNKNRAVDEKMLLQAIRRTLPHQMVPVIMKHINRYKERFNRGTANDQFEQSPDDLYRHYFNGTR